MRGNETRMVLKAPDSVHKFPIPMRGNETVAPADWQLTRPEAFPIPMRGHEIGAELMPLTDPEQVPDPHEG